MYFCTLSDIFSIHKTYSVIQPTIFDGENQRKTLTSTRQTVNQSQLLLYVGCIEHSVTVFK